MYACINDHKWCMQQHACWCIYDHVCILTRDTVAQHGNLTKKKRAAHGLHGDFLHCKGRAMYWDISGVFMFGCSTCFGGFLWHWPNRDWGISHVYLLQLVNHHNWSLLATPESPERTYLCLHIIHIYIYHICVIHGRLPYAYVCTHPIVFPPKPSNTTGKSSTGLKTQHHPIQLPSTGLIIWLIPLNDFEEILPRCE